MESPPQKPKRSVTAKGGAREGSGRPNLQELNLVPLQTRMSLPPEVIEWLDMCATYRDGEPKKFPERYRVDVLRDIITAVASILQASGLSGQDQALMTKRLNEMLTLKDGVNDGETGGST